VTAGASLTDGDGTALFAVDNYDPTVSKIIVQGTVSKQEGTPTKGGNKKVKVNYNGKAQTISVPAGSKIKVLNSRAAQVFKVSVEELGLAKDSEGTTCFSDDEVDGDDYSFGE